LRLRVLAFAVDLAWVTLALLVPILVGTLIVDSLWVAVVLLAVGLVTYHTVWVWLSGQTPGKAMYDLSVRHGTSAPARTWQGLLWCLGRHSVGYLLADLLGVGFLFALTPRSRRCPHDYVFGSTVVIRATGAERAWSPMARLDDYDKRVDASIEERGKRYAPLLSVWKKQTKLLTKSALLVIFLLGRSPDSPLGKLWARVQRRIGRWMTQARSAAAAPVRPPSAWARAGLWAVTGGVVVTVTVVAVQLLPSPPATPQPIDKAQGTRTGVAPAWTLLTAADLVAVTTDRDFRATQVDLKAKELRPPGYSSCEYEIAGFWHGQGQWQPLAPGSTVPFGGSVDLTVYRGDTPWAIGFHSPVAEEDEVVTGTGLGDEVFFEYGKLDNPSSSVRLWVRRGNIYLFIWFGPVSGDDRQELLTRGRQQALRMAEIILGRLR
jgi:uncharacterized RDD family membrane protein YckC